MYCIVLCCCIVGLYKGHNVRKSNSDICAQLRFKSACAFVQSDQNLHCMGTFCIAQDPVPSCRKRRLFSDDADAQADLSQKVRFLTLRLKDVDSKTSRCTCSYHYENTPIQMYWKFYHQKIENFQIKNSDIFHISAQNIDCGYSLEPPRRGGSNEYPHSMFWAEIRKIMYTPVNPTFTI